MVYLIQELGMERIIRKGGTTVDSNSLSKDVNIAKMTKKKLNNERRRIFIKRYVSNFTVMFGTITLSIMLIIAVFAPLIATHDPYEIVPLDRLVPPDKNYWFGTDNMGRDLFSRVIYGTQVSMLIGLSVALLSGIFGMILGLYSGYYKFLDHVLMRFNDSMMAFPAILLAMAIMAALGAKSLNVILAVTIVMTPQVARVIRSRTLVLKEQTFVEVLKSQGASSFRIIWLHIAPNTVSQLIIQLTYVFAIAIIIEASLSFLGVGIPAPDPSWGSIIYESKSVIHSGWWMVTFPAIFIIFAVWALNLFGDGLRDLLDPHSAK